MDTSDIATSSNIFFNKQEREDRIIDEKNKKFVRLVQNKMYTVDLWFQIKKK